LPGAEDLTSRNPIIPAYLIQPKVQKSLGSESSLRLSV